MGERLWSDLDTIDILRERLGVGYEEARRLLDQAEGDLIRALAEWENEGRQARTSWKEQGGELWWNVQEKLSQWSRTKITLKHRDQLLMSVSVPLGIGLGYLLWRKPAMRMLALTGIAVAAANDCKWQIHSVPSSGTGAAWVNPVAQGWEGEPRHTPDGTVH